MSEEMSFEQAMKRLEEIVTALEDAGLSLEQALALYREGAVCAKLCRRLLTQARHELKVWDEAQVLEETEE